jgi:hypothetical protein
MASAWDQIAKGFGDAIADIREKVVEEPMYGRVINERESAPLQWPQAVEVTTQPEPAREREQAQDKDIDR